MRRFRSPFIICTPKLVVCGGLLTTAALGRATHAQEKAGHAQEKKATPHKRALLVGVSKYERGGALDWPNLACETDLATMKEVLISRFGFAPEDITLLTNEKATRAGIIAAFRQQLVAPARPGDISVFHFSGHGQPVADDNGDEVDGLDESLVPYDYLTQSARDGAKTNLRDDELGKLLEELRQKMRAPDGKVDGSISVFIDSCHSGTVTRGQTPNGRLRVRGRGWSPAIDGPKPTSKAGRTRGAAETALPTESASGLFAPGGARAQGDIVISACDSDQVAQETENDQGVGMGAFTYHLTRALSRATPGSTYRDLFEKMNVEMTGSLSDQNPQLEGDIDKTLFGGATLPAPDYLVVGDVKAEDFSLPGGSLQGLTKGSRFAIFKAGSNVNDAQNRLGEAEIYSVDAVSSRAKWLPEYAGAIKPDDLKAARAVETARNYASNALKVWVDGALDATSPRLRDALAKIPVVSIEGVTPTNFDVRVREEGNNWILERKDGSLAARISAQGSTTPLREALLGQWRWGFLSRLRNDHPRSEVKIEMRLVPVNVETDAAGRVTKVLGDRKDSPKSDGSRTTFQDGDCVMLELRNPADFDAYVSVLDLSADGSIAPVFPNPDAPNVSDNRIPADAQWHRILGTPETPFVLRLGAPYGGELFKAIATREKADFTPLLSVPSVEQRGENTVLQTLQPQLNPLGQLLLSGVMGGRRGSSFAGVPPSNWATADVAFEVKAP